MNHRVWMLALAWGCGEVETKDDDTDLLSPGVDTDDAVDTDTDDDRGDGVVADLPAPQALTEGRFTTVESCTDCHTSGSTSQAMKDASGRDISPGALWPATMMANAARDPIWRAVVEREVALRPAAAGIIEDKCQTCHAPMKQRLDAADGELSRLADLWAGPRAGLGLEGVACAACHQIDAEGLGTEASFTGGFTLGPLGVMFGPHANPFDRPMQMNSGFTPTLGEHVSESKLCGTCHTVITPELDEDGEATGTMFHEQTTYLEWRASAFNDEGAPGPEASSCQACHTPRTDEDGVTIETAIARRPDGGDFPPVGARDSYGRHVFVGANVLGLTLLRDHADTLQPRADAAAFDAQVARTEAFLADNVHLSLGEGAVEDDTLVLPITVSHDAGHKFPTGFPSRRAWLAVTITDAAGAIVLRSGHWDAGGRIVDAAGLVLAFEQAGGPEHSHVDVVDGDETVAIWQMTMADASGAPTTGLLTAARLHSDNRLLPRGWDPTHAGAMAAPASGVAGDADFVPGADTVHLQVDIAGFVGPFTVDAQVAYQALSARWQAELAEVATPSGARLQGWLEETPVVVQVLRQQSATVAMP